MKTCHKTPLKEHGSHTGIKSLVNKELETWDSNPRMNIHLFFDPEQYDLTPRFTAFCIEETTPFSPINLPSTPPTPLLSFPSSEHHQKSCDLMSVLSFIYSLISFIFVFCFVFVYAKFCSYTWINIIIKSNAIFIPISAIRLQYSRQCTGINILCNSDNMPI